MNSRTYILCGVVIDASLEKSNYVAIIKHTKFIIDALPKGLDLETIHANLIGCANEDSLPFMIEYDGFILVIGPRTGLEQAEAFLAQKITDPNQAAEIYNTGHKRQFNLCGNQIEAMLDRDGFTAVIDRTRFIIADRIVDYGIEDLSLIDHIQAFRYNQDLPVMIAYNDAILVINANMTEEQASAFLDLQITDPDVAAKEYHAHLAEQIVVPDPGTGKVKEVTYPLTDSAQRRQPFLILDSMPVGVLVSSSVRTVEGPTRDEFGHVLPCP